MDVIVEIWRGATDRSSGKLTTYIVYFKNNVKKEMTSSILETFFSKLKIDLRDSFNLYPGKPLGPQNMDKRFKLTNEQYTELCGLAGLAGGYRRRSIKRSSRKKNIVVVPQF
jgi:hypothetical protein